MSLLIKNVLLNQKKSSILIEKDRISKIISDTSNIKSDDVFDGEGMAAYPAFYNTHTHFGMSVLRGVGDKKKLFDWLNDEIFPREAKLTSDDVYAASRFSILEMIKNGTVFFSDMYFFNEATIKAMDEMGVRAAVSFVGFDLFDEKETERRKELATAFLESENPCPDRLKKTLACHAIYTTSEDLFRWTAETAKEKGVYMHIHANETQKEVVDCLEKYGKRPIELMAEWGNLTDKTVLAHCVHLDDKEFELMKEYHAVSSTCPCSNMKLGSGFYPYQKMKEYGILQTIGTDGVASNNNLNMMEEMKFCSLMAKAINQDASVACADEVFQMATENGARAFGFNAGKIEEGKLADLMLVRTDHYSLHPYSDTNLVYSATPECIDTVICGGKILMKNRHVEGEEEIIAKADEVFEKIK